MAIIDRIGPEPSENHKEPDFFSRQVRTARRFFRPERQGRGVSGFHVVSGGMEVCIPGYEIQRDDFPYWAVELVTSGRGSLTLNGEEFELIPGALYIYGPGIRHRIAADRQLPMEKYFVDLVRPETQPASGELLPGRLDNGVIYSRSPESLRRTFEELLEFGSAESPLGDEICTKTLELLLLKIRESSIDHRLTRSPAFAAYRRCRLIIENRFLELTTAGEVAALANVDISYLCRLFSRFDVQSPYKILSRLRMNYAAGMLVREGLSVKQAAMELGYEDPFTFSRLFKSTMGLSPQNFADTYVKLDNIVV